MKLKKNSSSNQFVRFLLVGGFNTVFGYAVFALMNWLLSGLGKYSYMLAALSGSLITITIAFLGYKWFVFKTRGNYLIEWARCLSVYGGTVLMGLAVLPIIVELLRPHLRRPEFASYIAPAITMTLAVLVSFVGHKYFSFRTRTIADVLKQESNSL